MLKHLIGCSIRIHSYKLYISYLMGILYENGCEPITWNLYSHTITHSNHAVYSFDTVFHHVYYKVTSQPYLMGMVP